jgi:endonuclease/exonuclease/phosphatase family metal-dependent hydrolase
MKKRLYFILATALAVCLSCAGEMKGPEDDSDDRWEWGSPEEDEPVADEDMYYPKKEGSFRIMTYNVGAFSKTEGYNSTNDIAAMIQEAKADAVGIQELDSCNQRHNTYQLANLASKLSWQYYFGRAMAYKNGAYGNGVVVPKTQKVIDRYTIPIPKSEGQNSETRCIAVIETDEYVFASTHIQMHGAMVQVNVINNWVKKYDNCGKPVFLVGDFNSYPDSEAIQALEGVWNRLSSHELTAGSAQPNKCIDYIFCYKKGAPVKVIGTHAMTRFHKGDVTKTSDHLPVYADVEF